MNKLKLMATALMLTISGTASAGFIGGQIDFTGGAVTVVDANNDGVVEEISGWDDNFFIGPFEIEGAYVVNATGDFSSVAGEYIDIQDPWNITPTANFWSVGEFSFDLNSITQNSGGIIKGAGLIKAAGFEDTEGAWKLTTQGTNGTFSWSSTTAVPEPASLALLGLGLIGLGVARRKQK